MYYYKEMLSREALCSSFLSSNMKQENVSWQAFWQVQFMSMLGVLYKDDQILINAQAHTNSSHLAAQWAVTLNNVSTLGFFGALWTEFWNHETISRKACISETLESNPRALQNHMQVDWFTYAIGQRRWAAKNCANSSDLW